MVGHCVTSDLSTHSTSSRSSLSLGAHPSESKTWLKAGREYKRSGMCKSKYIQLIYGVVKIAVGNLYQMFNGAQ
jgi:hypothetical protein